MIIFKYQLGYILTGKRRLAKSLDVMKPELERYTRITGRIKEKGKERNTLLSEKKATPVLNLLKHRELSRRIAEMLGEEESRSIRKRLHRKEYEKQSAEKKDVPQKKKSKDRGWGR